jgi:imidazolonepropionase-like amidohydrolase
VVHELRNAIAKGIVPGPRILSSGSPITCPGGHLHFLGGVTEGRAGIARLAEQLVEEGADVIKIIATGGNMTQGSDPLAAQFTIDEMHAAVEVARAAGLRTTVHARGVNGIRAAVRAGVNGIEHARMEVAAGKWEFDDELAREMAANGITAAPTFAASYRAFQCAAAGGSVGLRAGAIPIPVRQENARRLRECGVQVVAGTDAGAALARFEEAINVEMELLIGAGWTPLEAIEAATIAAAGAIGREKDIGSLEAGKLADLVVVRGDPTLSITDIRQVERVFMNGRIVVGGGQVQVDARPHPWPLNEIAERPSLNVVAQ